MDEKQVVKQSVETMVLLQETLSHHERENKRLWCAVMALIGCVMIMAGCMVYTATNAQRMVDDAVWKALNAVGEVTTTTTTTQTVDGDSAVINNGDWSQYNDGAVHSEGAAE